MNALPPRRFISPVPAREIALNCADIRFAVDFSGISPSPLTLRSYVATRDRKLPLILRRRISIERKLKFHAVILCSLFASSCTMLVGVILNVSFLNVKIFHIIKIFLFTF